MRPEKLHTSLTRNPWFQGLPDGVTQKMIELSAIRHYEHGACIHRKLDSGDGMFGIVTGQVKITSTSRDGQEMILTFLQPGHWFGEIALIDGQARTHDAWAHGQTEILFLCRAAFETILAEHPELAHHLLKLLCQRLRTLLAVYDDSCMLSLSDRLCFRLAHLAKNFGHERDGEILIDMPLSQDDLAFMLGVSRQTIHKELAALSEQRLVRKAYGRLSVNPLLLDRYPSY